jgi:hypothetical protein
VTVAFYDELGRRLYTDELEKMPKVGDILDIPVVHEGLLRLVVTVVLEDGKGVIVEPPDTSN